jgi:alpha-tubulin suppressor-like RCC1 family protein
MKRNLIRTGCLLICIALILALLPADNIAHAFPRGGSPDLPLQNISAGDNHTCAVLNDGTISCWGLITSGQTTVPALPPGLTYTQVSAGENHSCGLRSDGNIICWGDITYGQTTVPVLPEGLIYTQVSSGKEYTCALRNDGNAFCWGHDISGDRLVPALPIGLTYTQISLGDVHTCGLRSDGSLICWGKNDDGQTNVPDSNFSQVSAGGYSTCALKTDNTLACWGLNTYNQVTNMPSGQFTQVSTGPLHVCALKADGHITCWGRVDEGQINVPILPIDVTYSQISAGFNHTCALRDNGTIICWGSSDYGKCTVPDLNYGATFTPPVVGSVVRMDPNPSNAAYVNYKVVFNEFVTGVNLDDFTLTTGITDANITSVTGSGSTYRVTVYTGSDNGTLRLDVLANGSIHDVTNLSMSGNFTEAEVYTIAKAINKVPVLSFISPDNKMVDKPGFTLIVFGTKFIPTSVVRFNGTDRVTTYVNPGKLTAAITSADLAIASVASVTVFNPTPGGGLSATRNFTVKNDVPVILFISPASKLHGKPVFTLNVYGKKFRTSAKVRWNGSDRPTTFVNSGKLTAVIAAADIASIGTASVKVFNPAPFGGLSNAKSFTIN